MFNVLRRLPRRIALINGKSGAGSPRLLAEHFSVSGPRNTTLFARRSMSTGIQGGSGDKGDSWGSMFSFGNKKEEVAVSDPFTEVVPNTALPSEISNDTTALTPSSIEIPSASAEVTDAVQATAEVVTASAAELSQWNPAHLMMQIIDNIHVQFDVPYYQAIVALGIALRVFMLPVSIKGMQTAARMQYVKPEMDKINQRMMADPFKVENKDMYDKEVKALFAEHKVNPFKQLVVPLLQIPVFFSMFFAIREMGTYFPDFASGGAQWFTDLTVADATYTLPVVNACLFLTIIELGGENAEMNNPQQKMMKNVFRGMGVLMVPLTMSLPQGLFVYWIGNGIWSIGQLVTLKNPAVKAFFDIPPPPPTEPQSEPAADEAAAAVSIDMDAIKADKSPFIKLYEENQRLIEANKKLIEQAKKEGKF